MIAALISGSLFRAPEQRTAKSGKPFVTASIKIRDADAASAFVRVMAFSESAQAELARLQDGEAVAVQGPLKVETYAAADGTTKISLSIVADHILPLRSPPKKRATMAKPSPSSAPLDRVFDDAIPF